jgi:hypothetical protein
MGETMTGPEYLASLKVKPKRSKYGAKRTTVDGINFDSAKEARRWMQLRQLEMGGEITNLERQVKIPLFGRDGPIMTNGGTRQRTYVADFKYVDWRLNGVTVIEDSKGMETPEFKLKKAILAAQNVSLLIT